MPQILHIETSGKNCSVAISKDGKVISHYLIQEERSHAAELTLAIENIIKETNLKYNDLDAVAVSEGPGSYTGLRIGVSVAKGICYGGNLPLIAVPTLEIMLDRLFIENKIDSQAIETNTLFVPMIDARRMEVYDCIYNNKCELTQEVKADIIDNNSFEELLKNNKIVFFGDGSNKCQDVITNTNATFIDEILPDAKYMLNIAEKKHENNDHVDLAYYEPFYLKEFQATIAKNTVLKDLKK